MLTARKQIAKKGNVKLISINMLNEAIFVFFFVLSNFIQRFPIWLKFVMGVSRPK